jgi:hypothetical protein
MILGSHVRRRLLLVPTHITCFYLLVPNIDVFKYILMIDIFILVMSNMGRRKYLKNIYTTSYLETEPPDKRLLFKRALRITQVPAVRL